MKFLVVWWILMSAVTYWFTKYSRFGKNVFQHNLKVEGSERDVIAFFCTMFAVVWPLWWLLMFPICICIGRKEPSHTNPARRAEEQTQLKKRKDKRRCAHFRFHDDGVEDEWCAKYGPHYVCLGSRECESYEEQKNGRNR